MNSTKMISMSENISDYSEEHIFRKCKLYYTIDA